MSEPAGSDIDQAAALWVSAQVRGTLSRTEQAAFERWYQADRRHQGAYLRCRALWLKLDDITVMSNVVSAIDAPPDQAHRAARVSRRMMIGAGLAATVVAAVAAAGQHRAAAVLRTTRGEFRKIPLSDRSVASLNTSSEVEVHMTPNLRRINLIAGEAWFDVAKNPDRPFVVEAGDVRVRAVGTAFSVRRRDAGAEILVSEGVVEVWSDAGTQGSRRLKAGEGMFISDTHAPTRLSSSQDEVERKLAWREGNLVLREDPLHMAVSEFNRYNAQQIIIADPTLNSTALVGLYRLDAPEDFAHDIHALLDVPVRISANSIIIGDAQIADAG